MTPEALRAWLILDRAPGIGPRTVQRLLAHLGDPQAVLAASSGALGAQGLSPAAIAALKAPDEAGLAATLAWAERDGAHILPRGDPAYPSQLRELTDAPTVLYVRGDPALLGEPQVAIVGSRNPTPAGRRTTFELARHLATCGLTITSGLAIGIDGAAHEGALEGGVTIAVLGTGPDRIYPAAHQELAHRIADRGALVSELPPGSPAQRGNFPRRNRIISGLSLGTLVTEAAVESGSLITARYAVEQGREVLAIPGSIHNPLARGCHALIKGGAKLVECAQDVLEELAPQLKARLASAPCASTSAGVDDDGLDAEYGRLLDALGHEPAAPDELIARTCLPPEHLASMLLRLELSGHIALCPGGRYCRSG